MGLDRRLMKLEGRLLKGLDDKGRCRTCRGRSDLGRIVAYSQYENGPVKIWSGQDPSPTPCSGCGRNLNVHVVFHDVDMINPRRRELGLEPLPGYENYVAPEIRFGR